MLRTITIGLAAALGAGLATNGVVMMAAPHPWYLAVPGVIETGPANNHFIRDIGMTYLLVGSCLVRGAAREASRAILWSLCGLWLAGHALVHLWEVAVGICGRMTLLRDFPAVTLPLVSLGLSAWAWRDRHRRPAPV